MQIEYNGYIINVFTNNTDGIVFKIIERLSTGKLKRRRVSNSNKFSGKRDGFGNKLSTPFESEEQAMERAKHYIDNYIVKWEEKTKL